MNRDSHEDTARRVPIRRPDASHDQRRLGAKFLARRLDWLFGRVVYWTGTLPEAEEVSRSLYRSTSWRVGRRLRGLPPGLYAVQCVDCDVSAGFTALHDQPRSICRAAHPRVGGVRRITERDVAEAARGLRGLDQHRAALGALVEDVDEWAGRARRLLAGYSAALPALSDLAALGPGAILAEGVCWWIGPESSRPSYGVETAALERWVRETQLQTEADAGWVWSILGRRRSSLRPRDRAEHVWFRLGEALPGWPIDLLCKVPEPERLLHAVLGGWGDRRFLRSAAVVAFARELVWWGGGERLLSGLGSLPSLMETVELACRSTQRRARRFLGVMADAIDAARDPIAAAALQKGPEGSDADWTRRLARALGRGGRGWRNRRRSAEQARGVVTAAYRSMMGSPLPLGSVDPREWVPLGEVDGAKRRAVPAELMQLTESAIRSPDAGRWCVVWAGMVGRVIARAGLDVAGPLTAWLGRFTEGLQPGARGDVHLRVSLHVFEYWVWVARRNRADWECLLGVAPFAVEPLFDSMRRRWWFSSHAMLLSMRFSVQGWLGTEVAALAHLGTLDLDQAEFLVRSGGLDWIGSLVWKRPERLPRFVEFLRGLTPEPEALGLGGSWAWLFGAGSDAMVAWFESLRLRWMRAGLSETEALRVGGAVLEYAALKDGVDPRLLEHAWVVDAFIAWAVASDSETKTKSGQDRGKRLARRIELGTGLMELALACASRRVSDPPGVIQALLRWWSDREKTERAQGDPEPRFPRFRDDTRDDFLEIAEGDPRRLCAMLEVSMSWMLRWDLASAGWRFLRRYPEAIKLLASMLTASGGARRTIETVSRVGLALRMHLRPDLEDRLRAWSSPRVRPDSVDRVWPVELSEAISTLVVYRKLAERRAGWERELREILDRPARLRVERDHLAGRVRTGNATPQIRARLANLETYFADPDALSAWVMSDLRKAVPRLVDQARRQALERVPDRVVANHWRRMFGSRIPRPFHADWGNALLLLCELEKNRSLLRRLLRHEAMGDRSWIAQHAGNRAWRARAIGLGVDVDRWRGPREWTVELGRLRWRVHAEDDPLRVLQMGNLFGTCLSRTGMNNFSTVANAVEWNKRVLYLTDEAGVVIGRKLLVLALAKDRGVLLGFRSYGATLHGAELGDKLTNGPWVKIVFDVFCGRWARELGVRLPVSPDEASDLSRSAPLFARWYNDGVEDFDGWIADTTLWPLDSGEPDRDRLLADVTLKLERADPRAGWRFELMRALGWLGDAATPLLERLRTSRLREAEVVYLEHCLRQLRPGL